jgi:outer membrane protein assembly factor BamB
MARLIIRYPNNVINEVEFDQPKYKIGLDEDNDLKLDNDEVTPHQAEIDTADGAYSIVDVSENNSTSVNGKKIEKVNLNYGDRISFGPVVGLFYPSKKGNVSDKTKVALYVITGAVVIFLSFFLIFFFTSRRLSTVVTQEIGEIITPETADDPPEERRQRRLVRRDRESEPRERDPAIDEEQEIIAENPDDTVTVQEKRFDAKKILYREKLILPEVDMEAIKKRDSVAIPRGMRRLLFRKIPVIVKAESVSVFEEKDLIEQVINVVEDTAPGGETALEEEISSIESPVPEDLVPGELNSFEEEFTAEFETGEEGELSGDFEESETPEDDTGLLSKLLAPITRLFRSNAGEDQTLIEEELEGELAQEESPGIFPIEAETSINEADAQQEVISGGLSPGEDTSGERTLVEESFSEIEGLTGIDIKLITEPSVSGSEIDGTLNGINGFVEEPVYSEREMQQFKEKYVLSQVPVSDSQDLNMNILWSYPEGVDRGNPYVRAGTVGKIDEDKYHDFLFGTKNGLLIAVSGDSGSEILRQDFGKPFFEPVLVDLNKDRSDDIVLTFEDGDIVTYTTEMERLWTYSGNDRITAHPLFIDINKDRTSDIIFSTLGMDIIAIDGLSGFEIWRFFDAESEIVFSSAGVDINNDSVDDVVFSTLNGYLYAIDGKTGWGLWKRNIYGRPAGSVAIGDLDGDNKLDIVSLAQNGILTGYGINGTLLFTYELNSTYKSAPSTGDIDGDGNDEILISDENGIVKSIEGKTRREEWSFATEEGTAIGRVALADVTADKGMNVIFTTLSGLLFVLDGKTGNQIALFNYGEHVFATPIVYDVNRDRVPEIISGSYEGSLVALGVSGGKKKLFSFMRSNWVSTNHDIKNTGHASVHLFKKLPGLNR